MIQPRTKPLNVLLIEDDPDDASLFLEQVRHFAPAEFDVTQARTLEAAMNELVSDDYQLVVIDLAVPGSAGVRTFAEIHTANIAIPFIALGVAIDSSARQALENAGAKAVLVNGDYSGVELVSAMRTASAPSHAPVVEPSRSLRTLLAEVA